MNITGIITEYNPFHNGHLYHLNSAKKQTNCDAVVCIMSGNFVQRGEPALIDKWKRCEIALNNGVDLIIELPTFYAVSSAEFFAKGAVSILDKIGVTNNIFFGSECGDIDKLSKIATILTNETPEFKNILKDNLTKGIPYIKAREIALINYFKDENIENILNNSNNILGIEYIKAILNLKSNINPITLKREGSNYNDKELISSFASATSIREYLKKDISLNDLQKFMPFETLKILEELKNDNYNFIFSENIYKYIKYKLTTDCINFNNLFDIKEGIENKILKEIYLSNSYEDLIFRIKSKRYTYTKISRLLIQLFIGINNYNYSDLLKEENLYARILGFNNKGKLILKEMKKKSTIPLITKLPKSLDNPLLELDIQATKAYSILNDSINPLSDYLISPIINNIN